MRLWRHFEKRAISHHKHYKYGYFHFNTSSSLFLDLKTVYFDPDFVSISAIEVKICKIMRLKFSSHFEKRAIGRQNQYKYKYFHFNACSSLFLDPKNVYSDPNIVSVSAIEVKICGIMRLWRPF